MKEKYRPINELALIFRGMNGDKEAQEQVTLGDVEAYIQADTFEEFLEINKLPAFEKVFVTYKPEKLSWAKIAKQAGIKDRSYCWKIINMPWKYTLPNVYKVVKTFGLGFTETKNIFDKIKKLHKD